MCLGPLGSSMHWQFGMATRLQTHEFGVPRLESGQRSLPANESECSTDIPARAISIRPGGRTPHGQPESLLSNHTGVSVPFGGLFSTFGWAKAGCGSGVDESMRTVVRHPASQSAPNLNTFWFDAAQA